MSADGVPFKLAQLHHSNPNMFLRSYVDLKYGKDYLLHHVIDAEGDRSKRKPTAKDVVSDLKSKFRITNFCLRKEGIFSLVPIVDFIT